MLKVCTQQSLSISAIETLSSLTWRAGAAAWAQQRGVAAAALAAQREAGLLVGPVLLPGRTWPYCSTKDAKVRTSKFQIGVQSNFGLYN